MTFKAAKKSSYCLLTFNWVDPFAGPSSIYLTNYTQTVTDAGQAYVAEPRMSIDLPANGIGVERNDAHIDIPEEANALFSRLADTQEVFDEVTVSIVEKVTELYGGSATDRSFLFLGFVRDVQTNINGSKGLLRVNVAQATERLKVKMGLIAGHQCPWIFTKKGCNVQQGPGPDFFPLESSGTVISKDGLSVTVSGLPARPNRWWHRGTLRSSSHEKAPRISIKEWNNGTTFVLAEEFPTSWIGIPLTFHAGCARTLFRCRNTWSNTDFIGNFGSGIPSYNPGLSEGI